APIAYPVSLLSPVQLKIHPVVGHSEQNIGHYQWIFLFHFQVWQHPAKTVLLQEIIEIYLGYLRW
ncbi:hypothetical protein AP221_28060, partial [Escherichia coli]